MSIKESLTEALGKENVSDAPDALNEYAGKRNFGIHIPPVAVAKIHSSEQAQALVKWANETKTPITPVSSKSPHIHGCSSPSVPNAVMADMSGMKKILNVNRQHRMAVIEPGVTYGELSERLSKEGLALSGPLKPRAGKSVVASVLELEPRLDPIHQWAYTDPLRCLEVTWGDGNRMYTGEAAGGPMDLQKQWDGEKWQVCGSGPWMFDFYRVLTGAQGSMGIVTWAAVKCQVKPSIRKVILVGAEDLEQLENFVYSVLHYRFSDEFFVLNNSQAAMLLGKSADEIGRLKKELPKWIAFASVCGRDLVPEKRVEVRAKDIGDIASHNGLKAKDEIAGRSGLSMLEKMESADEDGSFMDKLGGSQNIFFITTADRVPEFVKSAKSAAESVGFDADDLCAYIQPVHLGVACHCEFVMPYDTGDNAEAEKARKFYEKASKDAAGLNAYYSRPYGKWAELQLNKDVRSYKVLEKLKSIFDPNGIMNPGKLTV